MIYCTSISQPALEKEQRHDTHGNRWDREGVRTHSLT